jgi:DUF1009 family protein
MKSQIGIIAGRGDFPLFLINEARKAGYECIVVSLGRANDKDLQRDAKELRRFRLDGIFDMMSFFKDKAVKQAMFAGKIDHNIIYNSEEFEEGFQKLIEQSPDQSPTSLIQTAIRFFEEGGIEIVDPTPFLDSFFCRAGLLTKSELSQATGEDVAFGWEIAKGIAEMDIGQTVIVKNKAVVAVEGMEGTDEAILRAGELAGKGTVVVKVCRLHQDPRIDLPAVGLDTIQSLVQSGAETLCFEAKKMPFFRKEEALSLAEKHQISIVAKDSKQEMKHG